MTLLMVSRMLSWFKLRGSNRQSLQTKRLQDIVSEACAVYQKKHMVTMDPGKWEQVVKQAGFPYSGENFFSAVKEALENEGI